MKIYDSDFTVRLVDLPTDVDGFVVPSEDDYYVIIVNSRLTFEKQREAFIHELEHIQTGDFFFNKSLEEIENY